jgi:hypothetical protein
MRLKFADNLKARKCVVFQRVLWLLFVAMETVAMDKQNSAAFSD